MFWQVLVIISVFLFIIGLVFRIVSLKRLPVHLRWELMPIPREKDRGDYGGSYLEEYEWWRQPHRTSFFSTIKYMIVEILLLRTLGKNNPSLWTLSFVFHLGIYLIILTAVLSIIGGSIYASSGISPALQDAISVIALMGYMLSGLGAVSLLVNRIFNRDLRVFSSLATYFNLAFIIAIAVTGLTGWMQSKDYGARIIEFAGRTMTFNDNIDIPSAMPGHIILAMLFLIYLPWSNMNHFITKFFTYHEVRWDDKPRDKRLAGEIASLSKQTTGWSAPHARNDQDSG